MNNQSDKNTEVVKLAYKAFNEADISTLADLFDDNCSWHSPGKNPFSGVYTGKGSVFSLFGHYGGDTGGTFKADLKHVLKCDHNKVVGFHHVTAMRKKKMLDVWCCIYFELNDGNYKTINRYYNGIF